MLRFIAQRILLALVSVWAIVTITFFLSFLAPGDPSRLRFERGSPEQLTAWRHVHGLDLPPGMRYTHYMNGLLHGDMGRPLSKDADPPILQTLASHFPNTALLAVIAIVIALVFGLTVGITAALKHNTWVDKSLMAAVLAGVSLPNFVLAPILIAIFSQKLGWLPPACTGDLDARQLVLPAVVLAARPAALIARMARSSMVETLRQEYIRAARARGLSWARVILGHALKNAFLPVLTSAGVSFGYLLSGSFVVESIFAVPGVGYESIASIATRDYSMIQGTTILLATGFVTINLIVDILYAVIDPRIRLSGREAAS